MDTRISEVITSSKTQEEIENFVEVLLSPLEKYMVVLSKVAVYFDQVCD